MQTTRSGLLCLSFRAESTAPATDRRNSSIATQSCIRPLLSSLRRRAEDVDHVGAPLELAGEAAAQRVGRLLALADIEKAAAAVYGDV